MIDILNPIALNIASSVLYDITKAVYKSAFVPGLEKQLKKVLINTLKKSFSLKYHDANLFEDISSKIVYSMHENTILDFKYINEIISNSLNDFSQSNLNPKMITTLFLNILPCTVIENPELNTLIGENLQKEIYRLVVEQRSSFSTMNEKLEGVTAKLDKLVSATDVLAVDNKFLKDYQKIILEEVTHHENSKLIPENYSNYFQNELFLEDYLGDNISVTLEDVYIMPHFMITDFPYKNDTIVYDDVVKFISDFANNNLKIENYHTKYSFKTDKIRTLFIKGAPGSGKSSLFYYLAHQRTNNSQFLNNYKVHFVKLIELLKHHKNQLNDEAPLEDILSYLGVAGARLVDSIFILDGLDEICTAKNLNINTYCRNLTSHVVSKKGVKIIITTRINYIDIPHLENKNVFNIKLRTLDTDDLELWTKNYFSLHKGLNDLERNAYENIEALNGKFGDYINLLSIPLLFYMVVVTGIKISKIESIGELYDQVLHELSQRNYNEMDDDFIQKHSVYSKIPNDFARQIAKELAYMMYISDQLLYPLTENNMEQVIHNAGNNCNHNVSHLDSYNKKQIEKLFLITFFYKESFDVVEFSHKSIMEFFAGEKLVDLMIEYSIDIKSLLVNVFIKKYITTEVYEFVKYRLISWQSTGLNHEKTSILKKRMYGEFTKLIHNNELNWTSNEMPNYITNMNLMFKVYWVVLTEIFFDEKKINKLLEDELVKEFMKLMFSLANTSDIPFLDNSVQRYTLSNCKLKNVDFERSFLEYSLMNEVELESVDLSYSKLHWIKSENSSYRGCSFKNANISNAILTKVEYDFCDFNYSNLESCKLNGLDFDNCNFKFSNMTSAHLQEINFNECNFDYCDMTNSVINQVDFTSSTIDNLLLKEQQVINHVTIELEQLIIIAKKEVVLNYPFIIVDDYLIKDELEEMGIKQENKKHGTSDLVQIYFDQLVEKLIHNNKYFEINNYVLKLKREYGNMPLIDKQLV